MNFNKKQIAVRDILRLIREPSPLRTLLAKGLYPTYSMEQAIQVVTSDMAEQGKRSEAWHENKLRQAAAVRAPRARLFDETIRKYGFHNQAESCIHFVIEATAGKDYNAENKAVAPAQVEGSEMDSDLRSMLENHDWYAYFADSTAVHDRADSNAANIIAFAKSVNQVAEMKAWVKEFQKTNAHAGVRPFLNA